MRSSSIAGRSGPGGEPLAPAAIAVMPRVHPSPRHRRRTCASASPGAPNPSHPRFHVRRSLPERAVRLPAAVPRIRAAAVGVWRRAGQEQGIVSKALEVPGLPRPMREEDVVGGAAVDEPRGLPPSRMLAKQLKQAVDPRIGGIASARPMPARYLGNGNTGGHSATPLRLWLEDATRALGTWVAPCGMRPPTARRRTGCRSLRS